jgi:alpha-amylase
MGGQGASAQQGVAAPPPHPDAAPEWWRGAVFYEIFVRSFRDSNGDGVGDLAGLIDALDYLNDGKPGGDDLGVDALWLMPVFESPSYHGYDVVDYETIERDYGTNADFDRLLAEAHRRGVRVIVDLVLNHTSAEHPWFVEASSPGAPRRDWYVWRDDDPGWTQPFNAARGTWHRRGDAYYYGLFWRGMPDLNFRTPAVRLEAERIAKRWLARGVDGFRLDAIRHLVEAGPGPGQSGSPDTHAYLREFAAEVARARPGALLVGEVWSDTADIAEYFGKGGDELALLFDFPLSDALVEGVKKGEGGPISSALEAMKRAYPPGAWGAPFLTNHDQPRVATQLDGDRAKLGLAAAILLTLPGSPFLYYGEELGMRNGPGEDDRWKRTPMAWDASPGGGFTSAPRPWHEFAPGREAANVAAQARDSTSLLARYRALVALRKASPALAHGDLTIVPAPPGVLAYLRRSGAETALVAHNLAAEPRSVSVPAAGVDAVGPLFADPGATAARKGAHWRFELPPRSSGAWRMSGAKGR